ncbi:peptidoglycan DD-metalloendopeptidase family protein [Rhizobium herbae]|jgi:murein DD-endopeptidase MepM/ murein hydrolase activator NlpD
MRMRVSSSVGKSAVRLLAAVLLASVATGCSSDASRFGGLFSKSDNLTTNSIASSNVPIPRSDVQGGGMAMPAATDSRQEAVNQPFPDPVNTASAPVSRAREASTPINVQRVALADPAAKGRDTSLDQPFPAARETAKAQQQKLNADPVTTSTTSKGGWSTANAPAVLLRQGDTVATLSKRFGVPEKEILKANGLKSSSEAEPGQRILIPTFGVASSAAKASASDAAASLDVDKQKNIPIQPDSRDVAILPGQSQSREKGVNRTDMAAGKQPVSGDGNGQGGTYTVKAGDSINRIAKANGVSVDALRKENGLTSAAIRIGQTLKIPGGNASAADQVVTASVPKKADTKVAKGDSTKPAEYTAPVAKQSVTEVASKEDTTEASPKATGISKYRWPVRGAVIAGYGANVEGNRNDGINISVPEGTPIKAAENGVVIYSGSSLKELGNAVLVRHDDGTVTVYGNASELKVQRGQKIQRGQTLAASGMSGTASQPQVHFEVRKNASAVNPATFLE